jgi:1-acyl-sn-glycerol-3-phosphate acyltransferase
MIDALEIRRSIVTWFLQGILGMLCKIDSREYREVFLGKRTASEDPPAQAVDGGKGSAHGIPGPMIIAINHINFLEVPLLVTNVYPRRLLGLVKEETWKNPIMAFLFNTFDAIPINRGGSYVQTFHRVREAMEDGAFIIVAPEGTRSGNGVLQQGKGGIVQLALSAGVPIIPVVHFGGQKIWENIRRFRRTPFCFRVGRPFRLKCEGRPGKTLRETMLNEVMGQMAALLPPEMRGIYAEQAGKSCEYLEFL